MRNLIPLLLLVACSNGADDDKTTGDDTEDTEVVDTDTDTDAVTDCLVADPPANLVLTDDAFPGTAAPAAWDAPDGCATTVGYEAALGTTAGGNEVIDWTDLGSALAWATDADLDEGTDYYISVRATDAEGNVSNPAATPAFQVWTPAALTATKALWLDARTGTFSDFACTQAAVDAGEVRCWQDRSGNDNHARLAPAVAGRVVIPTPLYDTPPTLAAAGWDGEPALDFRGGHVLLVDDADSLDLSANFSIFVVNHWHPLPTAWGRPPVIDYPINKEVSWEVAYYNGYYSAAVWTDQPWAWDSTTRPQTRDKHLEVFQHLDTTWRFRADGVLDKEQPPAAGTGRPAVNDERVTLGGREDGQARSYHASMAELLVVDGVLSDAELAKIERYLMARWSIEGGEPLQVDTGTDTGI